MTNPADDYLNGREAFNNPSMRDAVASHFSGKIKLNRSNDWFYGFQDAKDDAQWDHSSADRKNRDFADMC
jgi:hypothetical protein